MTTESTNAGSQAYDQAAQDMVDDLTWNPLTAIYIDPALLAKLDALVAKEGGTRQSFLNDLLRDYEDGPLIAEVHDYTLAA